MPLDLSMTFAMTEIRGDWQWHVFLFELWRAYWKCGAICHRCYAARIPRLPKKFHELQVFFTTASVMGT